MARPILKNFILCNDANPDCGKPQSGFFANKGRLSAYSPGCSVGHAADRQADRPADYPKGCPVAHSSARPVAHSSARPVARSSGRPLIQSSGRPSGRRSFIKWRRMPILALAAIGRLAGQPSHQPACHRSRSATGSPTGRPHILQYPSFPPPITDRGDGYYIKNFTKIGVFSCNSKKNSKNSG